MVNFGTLIAPRAINRNNKTLILGIIHELVHWLCNHISQADKPLLQMLVLRLVIVTAKAQLRKGERLGLPLDKILILKDLITKFGSLLQQQGFCLGFDTTDIYYNSILVKGSIGGQWSKVCRGIIMAGGPARGYAQLKAEWEENIQIDSQHSSSFRQVVV